MVMAKKSKRHPGRPKGAIRKVEVLHARIHPVLKHELNRDARRGGLSITQNAEKIIANYLGFSWPVELVDGKPKPAVIPAAPAEAPVVPDPV
jgi:hypothetical protein